MIKELGEALKEWQREWHGKRDEVVASVLYSDIGKVSSGFFCNPSI